MRCPLPRAPALLLLSLLGLAGCPRGLAPRWPRSTADDPRTYITFFHMGQADCMLVVHRGKSLMVDAGATWTRQDRDNYRDVPRRLEELTGRRRLDYFVVSHYHQDHIGLHGVGPRAGVGDLGLWGLINDLGVTVDTMVDRGSFVIGPKGATQRHYERAVIGWRQEGKVRRRLRVKRGDTLDMGPGLRVEVVAADGNGRLLELAKSLPDSIHRYPPSENDYSIVLKLTKGDFELATGGDLSGFNVARSFGPVRVGYFDIESEIAGAIGDLEVYHVHHHGSKNSSNPCFLSVLRPEVSIFTTGSNRYHHPHERVFDALTRAGRVFITSGADPKVYARVKGRILAADVNLLVSADGSRYWVNGEAHRSRSEAQELALPRHVSGCSREGKPLTAADFTRVRGGQVEGD